MSIIIRNVSTGVPTGVQQYELKINQRILLQFEHTREDGLAVCLRKAADAVEADRDKKVIQILLLRTE